MQAGRPQNFLRRQRKKEYTSRNVGRCIIHAALHLALRMYVYLSKKIAIPNGTRLASLDWNGLSGWICCGGEEGLLKACAACAANTVRTTKHGGGLVPDDGQTPEDAAHYGCSCRPTR